VLAVELAEVLGFGGDPFVGAVIGVAIEVVVAMPVLLARRRGSPIE
jgi:hypothetical protein